MFKNLFLKTLYEKRWMMVGWSVGVIVLVMMTVTLFPTFKESLSGLENVPDSLKSLIGDAASYSTIKGYVNLQVFQQLPFMTIILSVILFSGLLAGEEADGVLQTQLVQPISRTSLFVQKFLAGSVIVAVVTSALFVSTWASVLLVHEAIPLDSLLAATFACWVIAMIFGVMTYALGAVISRRGLSGAIVGAFAFATYLITGLSGGVDKLKTIEKVSPFHYYNSPSILDNGINWPHIGLLFFVMLLILLGALIRFEKRDVYQR